MACVSGYLYGILITYKIAENVQHASFCAHRIDASRDSCNIRRPRQAIYLDVGLRCRQDRP